MCMLVSGTHVCSGEVRQVEDTQGCDVSRLCDLQSRGRRVGGCGDRDRDGAREGGDVHSTGCLVPCVQRA